MFVLHTGGVAVLTCLDLSASSEPSVCNLESTQTCPRGPTCPGLCPAASPYYAICADVASGTTLEHFAVRRHSAPPRVAWKPIFCHVLIL